MIGKITCLVAVMCALWGCNSSSTPNDDVPDARPRPRPDGGPPDGDVSKAPSVFFLHALSGEFNEVDLTVGDQTVDDLAFGTVSDATEVALGEGNVTVEVREADADASDVALELALEGLTENKSYLAAIFGDEDADDDAATAPRLLLVELESSAVVDKSEVQLMHLSPDAPATVDVGELGEAGALDPEYATDLAYGESASASIDNSPVQNDDPPRADDLNWGLRDGDSDDAPTARFEGDRLRDGTFIAALIDSEETFDGDKADIVILSVNADNEIDSESVRLEKALPVVP